MIVIKNKLIPFGDYETINLFGVLFTKGDIDHIEYNHERIHSEQMLECAVFGAWFMLILIIVFEISILWLLLSPITFYVFYGLEYVCIRLFHKKQSDAYHDVSFEEEAYDNQEDMAYIKQRIPFAWIEYVKLKSN